MPIYPNFYQTLSACPIVELRGYAAACGLKGRLYAYLDFAGPTGTARDGLAEGMLALAIEKKKLISGQPIIEAASGPFAAALTLAGLTAGHPVVLVMPEDAPALRQETLLRLGAQIRHSPARSGVNGARRLAAQTAAANGWYYMDWLANDDNPEYHRRVTGPAIVQSIAREGKSAVDAIVIGVGSGGTVTGVGETIKAWTNDVRIAAVEPYESQALGGGLTGSHGISDLGYGFVPENFNAYVVDNVVAVNTTDAQRAAQKVLRKTVSYGWTSAMQQATVQLGKIAVQAIVNTMGVNAMAAFTAASRIDDFAYTPQQNIGHAMTTLMAQNRGAGKHDRVKQGFHCGMRIETAYGVLIAVVCFAGAPFIMKLFVTDPEVVHLGVRFLRTVSLFYLMPAATNGIQGFFRGIGDLKVTLVSSTFNMVFRAAAAAVFVLVWKMEIEALPYSYAVGWVVMLLYELPMLVRYLRSHGDEL